MIKVNFGVAGPSRGLGGPTLGFEGPEGTTIQYLIQYLNGQKWGKSRVLILEYPIGKGVHIAPN